MAKKFTVTDGKLVLVLQPAEKGWYAVTCPFDPALNTQAKSIEEAFVMAYDAKKTLKAARSKGSANVPARRSRSVSQGQPLKSSS